MSEYIVCLSCSRVPAIALRGAIKGGLCGDMGWCRECPVLAVALDETSGAGSRGGAMVARQAHNLEVEGSSPSPATTRQERRGSSTGRTPTTMAPIGAAGSNPAHVCINTDIGRPVAGQRDVTDPPAAIADRLLSGGRGVTREERAALLCPPCWEVSR